MSNIDTPVSVPNLNLKMQARGQAIPAVQTPYLPLASDVQGFDAEALQRFQQTLPTFKHAYKPGEEKEEFIDANGNVIDEPMWQVAQADGGATTSAVLEGGGGAAGGAAGGGAGGAAAGGAAAGAAPAAAALSPLAFAPAALLLNPGSDNHAPSLSYQCADADHHTIVGPVHLRLALDSGLGEGAIGAIAVGTDPDNNPLNYLFSDGAGHRSSYADAAGHLVTNAADAFFVIDPNTGVISLGVLGLATTDANNAIQFVDHLHDTYNLQVVAFDGGLQSNVVNVVIERGLHAEDVITFSTLTDAQHTVLDGTTHDDSDADVTHFVTGHTSGDPSDLAHLVNHLDVLDLDLNNVESLGFDTEYKGLSFHRDGDNLHIEFNTVSTPDQIEEIQICNQYGFDFTDGNGTHHSYAQSVEFIHFAAGSTFAGYELNPADSFDDCMVDANGNPVFASQTGNYLLSLANPDETGLITGTDYNDVIVGTDEGGETLDGLAGNDLLFSHGEGDTLCGDDGNDLLVADGGSSTLDGGAGDDTLVSNGYGDTLIGGAGNDHLVLSDNGAATVVLAPLAIDDTNVNGTDLIDNFFGACDPNNVNIGEGFLFVDSTVWDQGYVPAGPSSSIILEGGEVSIDDADFLARIQDALINVDPTAGAFVITYGDWNGAIETATNTAHLWEMDSNGSLIELATFNNVTAGAFTVDNFLHATNAVLPA